MMTVIAHVYYSAGIEIDSKCSMVQTKFISGQCNTPFRVAVFSSSDDTRIVPAASAKKAGLIKG